MRDTARAKLDRIDKLRVKQGMLEAFVFGRGDLHGGSAGAALDYGHRISENFSAFARGEVGPHWGDKTGLGWETTMGIRGRF